MHFQKTTPQLLGDIGLQNKKVGVKSNFGRIVSLILKNGEFNSCYSIFSHQLFGGEW